MPGAFFGAIMLAFFSLLWSIGDGGQPHCKDDKDDAAMLTPATMPTTMPLPQLGRPTNASRMRSQSRQSAAMTTITAVATMTTKATAT